MGNNGVQWKAVAKNFNSITLKLKRICSEGTFNRFKQLEKKGKEMEV